MGKDKPGATQEWVHRLSNKLQGKNEAEEQQQDNTKQEEESKDKRPT